MLIETRKNLYNTKINLIQIELTGYCNMKCKHCRASQEPKEYFKVSNYNKILELIKAEKGPDFKLTFSGGEPFLHPEILNYVKTAKDNGINKMVITTNGSLVTDEMLKYLNNLKLGFLMIQLSIDSLDAKKHDDFRGFTGAFDKCDKLLDRINNYDNIFSSIRMTVNESTINDMENMVNYAIKKHCKVIGFGSIIPFGKAEDCSMSFNSNTKKKFLEEVCKLNKKYNDKIEVVTEDPLKSIVVDSPWSIIDKDLTNDYCFGGCTAGIDSLNVQCNGIITPCSMIKEMVLNLNECQSIEDIKQKYKDSDIIVKLFEKQFEGKCGICKFKNLCSGCRASAKGRTNNLFGSDESCWLINE